MARGKKASPGDTRVAPNGYHYTRTEKEWRLTHHIVAEMYVIGRPLLPDERVSFKDGDRTNMSIANLIVSKVASKSKAARKAAIETKIEDLQRQLAEIDEEE